MLACDSTKSLRAKGAEMEERNKAQGKARRRHEGRRTVAKEMGYDRYEGRRGRGTRRFVHVHSIDVTFGRVSSFCSRLEIVSERLWGYWARDPAVSGFS